MLRLSTNISMLFTELPVLERPAAAAATGFRAIEMQFPYSVSKHELAAASDSAGVEFVLINLSPGEPAAGELGLACLPGREPEFAASVEAAIEYARTLRCSRVNCLVGNRPAGESRARCWEVLVGNLWFAADRLAVAGIQLLVEPLNPVDFPNFLLTSISDADALIAAAGHPNLMLQYDVYHRRAAAEDWLGGLIARLDRIGHIQFADYPGRHEPGTGELDFPQLFALLDAGPYQGWIGCEYRPLGATADSFAWYDQMRRRPAFDNI